LTQYTRDSGENSRRNCASSAAEQLFDPVHARLGRELAQELRKLGFALPVGRDLDVVQEE
jgi:hypothetical protein